MKPHRLKGFEFRHDTVFLRNQYQSNTEVSCIAHDRTSRCSTQIPISIWLFYQYLLFRIFFTMYVFPMYLHGFNAVVENTCTAYRNCNFNCGGYFCNYKLRLPHANDKLVTTAFCTVPLLLIMTKILSKNRFFKF